LKIRVCKIGRHNAGFSKASDIIDFATAAVAKLYEAGDAAKQKKTAIPERINSVTN
jgi:hypothetical protein